MALFIKRKPKEAVLIGDSVTVFVHSIQDGEVELGFEAPRSIEINRREGRKSAKHSSTINHRLDDEDYDNRGNR